jgi:nitrite reductase/ring-hydroxylating ferredoxin subunit/uncharacterized membrane protein
VRAKANIKSHPIHPMLVAFPIALFITSFALDVAGIALDAPDLWAAGFYCAIAGLVGGFCAAVPGLIDWLSVVPPKSSGKKRGLLHAGLNVIVLALFLAAVVRRGAPDATPDGINIGLTLAGVLILFYSGWLGATLVYRNQIGVDHRYANAGKFKQRTLDSFDRPVCNQAELSEGQMMLAEIQGERIVIGRCPEGMVAFSDHCTHRGGALSDGVLIGCAVQCPWHGSQFDVHTGRVIAGPAHHKIGTYDVEVRNGEVYVRRTVAAPTKGQEAA